MANYTQNDYNLVDVTKMLAPDNTTFLNIVDNIKKDEPIVDDLQWEEGNGITTHVIGQIVGRPEIKESMDNKGYGKGKDEIKNVTEESCEIGSDNEIDVRTLARSSNPMLFRAKKDDSHVVSHTEKFVNMIFGGNRKTNPMQINGLYNRPEWQGTISSNGLYQINAGGASGNALYDAFLIEHGEEGLKMWYPRGSKTVGVNIEDKGEQRVLDSEGNPFYAHVTHFDWKFGIGIYNPRNIIRVSNIRPDDSTQTLEEVLVRAIGKLKNKGRRASIYLPQPVFDLLDIRAMKGLNAIKQEDVFGRKVTTFRGLALRVSDELETRTYSTART
jgi:hypothetical protein